VPKEIILVDKLPLTAVGKPIKHLLQLDAAKRVFSDVLRPLSCAWELEVVNTGGSGLKVSVALKGSTVQARQQAEEILSSFSVPYSIREIPA
jgi:fatty-acyl-CoA synthase